MATAKKSGGQESKSTVKKSVIAPKAEKSITAPKEAKSTAKPVSLIVSPRIQTAEGCKRQMVKTKQGRKKSESVK